MMSMMSKKFRCLVLAMVLIFVFVSCTTFAADKPIKLVFGHVFNKDFYFTKGDLLFKELVEKNSNGQISVEIYPDSQLGPIPEMIQATQAGSQQMTIASGTYLGQYWKKLGTFDLPYLYRDQKHFTKVEQNYTSLINQDEMAQKTGMRMIGYRDRTFLQLVTKFPVKKLQDLKGKKIRVNQSPISVALWKALGAIPAVIPAGEMYTALATGVVAGGMGTFDGFWLGKLYEQAKYGVWTNQSQELLITVISEKFWKTLTKEQQMIIQDAMDKSNALINKLAPEVFEEYNKLLVDKAGAIFCKPNLKPFMKRAKPVLKEFGDAELIKKIQAIK
jgi:tripartite ATP-independent transporter DctP family solute receptor